MAKITKLLVIIDIGHGGSDPGANGNGVIEKVANYNTGMELKSYLEKHGVKVVLTRTNDNTMSLEARTNYANKVAKENPAYTVIFVSVHHNAGGGDRGEYIHSIYLGDSKAIAESIGEELNKQLGQQKKIYSKKSDKTNKDYYHVIRATSMPAIIVEVAFLDNKTDVQICDTVGEQQRNGRVIGDGILKWAGISKKPNVNTSTEDNKSILGKSEVAADKLYNVLVKKNPKVLDKFKDIAKLYIEVSNRYGICGDIAFCQAMWETGWLKFGGDVLPGQNNFAGIGTVGGGVKGASFETVKDGVIAHIQHLYAYASKNQLPTGEKLIDPRFNLVTRGSAIKWIDLNGKWAVPGKDYGQNILKIYKEIKGENNAVVPNPSQPPKPVTPVKKHLWELCISGQLIKDLQIELNKQCNAKLKVDGYFGDSTLKKCIVVKRGARGNITKVIQKRLQQIHYNIGKYGADGDFGKSTYDAVVRFQKAKGLAADGIVGKNTWKALMLK